MATREDPPERVPNRDDVDDVVAHDMGDQQRHIMMYQEKNVKSWIVSSIWGHLDRMR